MYDVRIYEMRGNQIMDHNEVVRQKLTEKYLLEELDGEARDQFEEHFFDCSDCALDVRAGSDFVTQTRVVFANSSEPAQAEVRPRRSSGPGCLSWLRPSFAVPALALLLAVIGYQNLVSFPRLQATLNEPRVLPSVAVSMDVYGPAHTVTVPQGKSFLVLVRIPPEGTYVRYVADLYNPAGKLDCSLLIPVTEARDQNQDQSQDQWPVLVPEGNREAGNYRISLRGVSASGQMKDLGSAPFTLQTQN
jgi:hypothetical protein